MVAVELPAEITASFVAEARSYLPLISASLSDLSNGEALSEAYRFAHTIKSSAAMMGHLGLSQLAELLEADLECVLLRARAAGTGGAAHPLGGSHRPSAGRRDRHGGGRGPGAGGGGGGPHGAGRVGGRTRCGAGDRGPA